MMVVEVPLSHLGDTLFPQMFVHHKQLLHLFPNKL